MTRPSPFPWLAAVVAVVVATLVPASPAAGESPVVAQRRRQQEIARQIKDLKDEVEESSAEEVALLAKLDATEARRQALDQKVAAMDRQLRSVEGELGSATDGLNALEAELALAQDSLQQADARLAKARGRLRDRAVAAYMGEPSTQMADVVLQMRTIRELSARSGYMGAVLELQRTAVAQYQTQRDRSDLLRKAVEAKRDEARRQRNQVMAKAASLEAARFAQEAVRREVVSHQVEQARLLAEVSDRTLEYEELIANLEAESGSISSFLRTVQTGQTVLVTGDGILSLPIPNGRVTSKFGPRLHPIFGTVRMHTGVDFDAPLGTPVRAATDGTVAYAAPRGGYGNAVILDHGGALATLYAHLSQLLVTPGTQVQRGQLIGLAGSTGYSTGPHLHFEVRVEGTPVDPLPYLGIAAAPRQASPQPSPAPAAAGD